MKKSHLSESQLRAKLDPGAYPWQRTAYRMWQDDLPDMLSGGRSDKGRHLTMQDAAEWWLTRCDPEYSARKAAWRGRIRPRRRVGEATILMPRDGDADRAIIVGHVESLLSRVGLDGLRASSRKGRPSRKTGAPSLYRVVERAHVVRASLADGVPAEVIAEVLGVHLDTVYALRDRPVRLQSVAGPRPMSIDSLNYIDRAIFKRKGQRMLLEAERLDRIERIERLERRLDETLRSIAETAELIQVRFAERVDVAQASAEVVNLAARRQERKRLG